MKLGQNQKPVNPFAMYPVNQMRLQPYFLVKEEEYSVKYIPAWGRYLATVTDRYGMVKTKSKTFDDFREAKAWIEEFKKKWKEFEDSMDSQPFHVTKVFS